MVTVCFMSLLYRTAVSYESSEMLTTDFLNVQNRLPLIREFGTPLGGNPIGGRPRGQFTTALRTTGQQIGDVKLNHPVNHLSAPESWNHPLQASLPDFAASHAAALAASNR